MDVKSTLKYSSCPLGKWKSLQVTKEDYLEIKELVKETIKLSPEQAQKMVYYSEKYLGKRIRLNNCGPCSKNQLDELKIIIEQYEK